jgi:hypothetical protein
VASSRTHTPLLCGEAAWDRQEPTSRVDTTKKAPLMESTMSEEPREAGMPEEPLYAAGAEPVPQEGEARVEPIAQGERREEQQARPEGAEEVSRVEALPEGAEETSPEAAPPEGTEGPS